MEQDLIEAMDEVKIRLIEGIINRQGSYDKVTFEHLFDFHLSVVKMLNKREQELKKDIEFLTNHL